MKRFLSALFAIVMLLSCLAVSPMAASSEESELPFEDITRSWAKDDILWAFENHIATGVSNEKFAPDTTLTRGMFITFLYRAARLAGCDVKTENAGNPFDDVKTAAWQYTAALWGYENGITDGVGIRNGKIIFAPDTSITREQTSTMLYRFLRGYLGCEIGTEGAIVFPDRASISEYARESFTALSALGVFKGDDRGHLNPKAETDRAAAASLNRRIYDLIRPEEQDAPAVRCVGFLKKNLNTEDLSELSFTTGRLHFNATLTDESAVILSTPDAEEENLKRINAADHFTIDGQAHSYDVIWRDNNAVVFYCDGERVDVLGRDRTYTTIEVIGETLLTEIEYQTPETAVCATAVTFSGDYSDVGLYDLMDESPLALNGALSVEDNHFVNELGEKFVVSGLCVFVTTWKDAAMTLDDGTTFCGDYSELKWLRDDWGINTIRAELEPTQLYERNDENYRETIFRDLYDLIENAEKVGLYVCVDWHGYLEDGSMALDQEKAENADPAYVRADPRIYEDQEAEFWGNLMKRFGDTDHILFEMYNEPTGGKNYPQFESGEKRFKDVTGRYVTTLAGYEYTWNEILVPVYKRMFDIIRQYDPDSILIANTPEAGQHAEVSILWPITDYNNVAYSVHMWSDGIMEKVCNARVIQAMERGACLYNTEAGFYPVMGGAYEYLGIEANVENTIWYMHNYWEDYLNNIINAYEVNYNYFWLQFDSKHPMNEGGQCCIFAYGEITNEQKSGWTDDQFTCNGEYMHHWFRTRAGLEDGSWFTRWHEENDAYYDQLIIDELGALPQWKPYDK